MTRIIESDADMPRSLSTARKQETKAKEIALAKSGLKSKKVRGTEVQGFFSRTRIVTLKDDTQMVIQFRVEPLDVAYIHKTRKLLGNAVPDIELSPDAELEQQEVWTYVMDYKPGTPWNFMKFDKAIEITAAASLGGILARGHTPGDTSAVVDKEIIPQLQALQASSNKAVAAFREDITGLLAKIEQVKALPLFIAHYDLNKTNILLAENGEVQGLADWELAADRPFGFGFHRVHDIAGEISQGEFEVEAHYEDVERAFWNAIFDGVSPEVRQLVDKNLQAVQIALHIGSILFHLELGEAMEYDEQAEKVQRTYLTYRLPMLRGGDPPYKM